MWVDYLHSFYRMPAILIIGGVPTVVTLRWYKAPAGAQRLPFGSAIFSHVWDNNPGESIPGEIGEVGAPRTWDPGNNVGYQGQCYRGDPTWFQTGQLPALAGIPPSPCLCQIVPAVGSGTLVLSGSAIGAIATLGCSHCPQGAPRTWFSTAAGGVGTYAVFNGKHSFNYVSGCLWQTSPNFPKITLTWSQVSGWNLGFQVGGTAFASYNTADMDCMAGGHYTLGTQSGPGGPPPPTATVTPS